MAKSIAEEGKIAGLKIREAFGKAGTVAKTLVLAAAAAYAGQPAAEDFLSGYAMAWDGTTGKVRKSECRSIFLAYVKKDVKLAVGLDAEKNPIYEIKDGKVWLEEAGNHWQEFVKLANVLKGSGGSSNTTAATRTVAKKLTDKQFKDVEERLKGSAGEMVVRVAFAALNALSKLTGFEAVAFMCIQRVCNDLKKTSGVTEASIKVAADIGELAHIRVSEIQAANIAKDVVSGVPALREEMAKTQQSETQIEQPQQMVA